MGSRSQFQIKMKQRERRKKRRDRITAKGEKPEAYFYGQYYIKLGAGE